MYIHSNIPCSGNLLQHPTFAGATLLEFCDIMFSNVCQMLPRWTILGLDFVNSYLYTNTTSFTWSTQPAPNFLVHKLFIISLLLLKCKLWYGSQHQSQCQSTKLARFVFENIPTMLYDVTEGYCHCLGYRLFGQCERKAPVIPSLMQTFTIEPNVDFFLNCQIVGKNHRINVC